MLIIVLFSCNSLKDKQYSTPIVNDMTIFYKGYRFDTIVIDRHTYIFAHEDGYHSVSIIHSQSCKFCKIK
jgi:hypothetical protein